MAKETKIIIAVFVLVFGGLGFLISRSNTSSTTPITKDRLIDSTSHNTVSSNAKVNIVEFGDFQCPACGAVFPIMEEILASYKDNPQVNFVARNFPLPQHNYALLAAEAAEASGAQGKYWEMYRLIYANQITWVNSADPLSIFVGYASELKLDTARFKSEVSGNKYESVIEKDRQAGVSLGVNSTPTFFINGLKVGNVQNIADFTARIDAALAE